MNVFLRLLRDFVSYIQQKHKTFMAITKERRFQNKNLHTSTVYVVYKG